MSAPSRREYDTIVVGAGPAGIMAAFEASLRSDVLLIEGARLPRDKSCGGMLHTASQRVLERFARIPDDVVVEPRHVDFRFHDWDRGIRKPVELTFVNVDRIDFDAWLLRTVLPPDVEVCGSCALKDLAVDEDGVIVSLDTDEGPAAVQCSNLIGADGARSTVRRALAADPPPTYVTLQEYVRLDGEIEPYFDCMYMRGIGEGFAYAYIVPKGDVAAIGSVYHPHTQHPGQKHDRVLEVLRERLPQLGPSVKREAAAALYLRSAGDVMHGLGRILLAGEAGGFMSPTSGEGISYALETGARAGQAVASMAPLEALETYRQATADLVSGIRRRFRWLPVMESPVGRYVAGFMPTPLVSRVTLGL
ncbi:MAG TPA: FAD-dependent monooxygenase [Coriobacteriia bacterium]